MFSIYVPEATAALLDRSYKNGPKAAQSKQPCTGVCHLCLAGRPHFDFEDLKLHHYASMCFLLGVVFTNMWYALFSKCRKSQRSRDAPYRSTMGTELPWEEESIITRVLLHEPDSKESFHKVDLFHTVNLGVGKSFAASSLVILLNQCHANSVDARLRELSGFYLEFCKVP